MDPWEKKEVKILYSRQFDKALKLSRFHTACNINWPWIISKNNQTKKYLLKIQLVDSKKCWANNHSADQMMKKADSSVTQELWPRYAKRILTFCLPGILRVGHELVIWTDVQNIHQHLGHCNTKQRLRVSQFYQEFPLSFVPSGGLKTFNMTCFIYGVISTHKHMNVLILMGTSNFRL